MKLSEYKQRIIEGEAGNLKDAHGNEGATAAYFGCMAEQIKSTAWQPGFRKEAANLADRAYFLAHDPQSPYCN